VQLIASLKKERGGLICCCIESLQMETPSDERLYLLGEERKSPSTSQEA